MKIYIAGPLSADWDRQASEEVAVVCEAAGFSTFLPHRDVGLLEQYEEHEIQRIFKADRDALYECQLVIAILSGPDVSSGTSWEIGYASALNVPVIGFVTDKKLLERLNTMIAGSTRLVYSLDELKDVLTQLNVVV